jgi:hypothetical protein
MARIFNGMTAPPAAESTRRLTRLTALTAATLLLVVAAKAQPVEQRPPLASTAALEEAAQTATVDAPSAALSISNREIIVLRATVMLLTPAIRAAGAERRIHDLVNRSSVGAVGSRPLGTARLVTIGPQDILAIVPADLDPAGTQTVDEAAAAAVARLQTALDEAVEARTTSRLAWAAGLALLATLALVVLLRLWAPRRCGPPDFRKCCAICWTSCPSPWRRSSSTAG